MVLVGYSFGGTVAFEIARQLHKSAAHDPLLIVIDMPIINAPGTLPPTLWRQALDVALNIPAWVRHESAHLEPRKFLVRAQGYLQRLARSFGGRRTAHEFDPRIFFGTTNLPATYRAFLTRRYEALLTFRPEPYDGKIILLRATVPTLFRGRDTRMGWQAVAGGGVEVHLIAGAHDDCISIGRGRELARLLMQCVGSNTNGTIAASH